jgi:plastocyanin
MLALVGTLALLGKVTQAAAPITPNVPPSAPAANPNAPLQSPNSRNPESYNPKSKIQNPKSTSPSVGAWTDIAPFPTALTSPTPVASSLKMKRSGAACFPGNGKCYVLGGRHGVDGEDITVRYIWEYTPGNPGTYVQKTSLLDTDNFVTRYTANMAVAVLTDTTGPRIYAIGGSTLDSNITGQVRAFNPVADTLATITSDPWPANPPRIPGGYAVYNNVMYIFGGFSSLANAGTGGVFTDTWRFDPMAPAGTKWSQMPTANLHLGRAYIAGAALDGKIYAIGGDTWNPSTRQLVPVANVERLDLAQLNPSWSSMNPLPGPRGDMSAWSYEAGTGYEISGSIVIAGGVFPVPDAKAYRYDPATDTWSEWVQLLHPTRNYGAAQLNGTLYAFGGYDYRDNIPSGANFSQRYDATGSTATPTNTPVFSPTATPTPFSTNYNVCAFTGISIVPGTTLVPSSQCDDCIVTVTLPFPYTLYDQTFATVQLSSNGTMGFAFPEGNPVNYCLPSVTAISAIFAYWDDLLTNNTGQGIYTSVSGSAPNRIFNVEWRAQRSAASGGGQVGFEIRLYEGSAQFDIVYGVLAAAGNTATVGVQRDRGSLYTQYSCNTAALSNNTQLLFTLAGGVCPTATPTFTRTITPTFTPTVTGTLPTFTSTPTITNTPCGNADYVISQQAGASIDAGITDTGNHSDDSVTNILLPFAYTLYAQTFTTANVSSNGNIQFVSSSTAFANACLPQSGLDTVILALWDDLRTDTGGGCAAYPGGCGIFTSISGTAPNRVFNIEWRSVLFQPATSVANFEIRLFEGQSRFDVVYGQVDSAGTGATVGVQNGTGSRFTEFECNTGGLSLGEQLIFILPACGTATPTNTGTPPTATPTRSATVTFTRTNTGTVTGTPSPAATCGPGADYVIAQSGGASIDPGVTDIGNHADDLVTAVNLPFPVRLYGVSYTIANISSNGNIQFATTSNSFTNTCLPNGVFDSAILAFWDDLDTRGTGNGIFTSVSGTAPNRILNVEWRVVYINTPTFLNFEIRLYENQDRFDIVYDVIPDGGVSATVGVQRGTGSSFTLYSCNTNSVTQGLQLVFTIPPCASPTPTNTGTPPTNTPTRTLTNTPSPTCAPSNYTMTQSTGASIVPAATDIGNHGDDVVTAITVPFAVQLYGQSFTGMNVSSNGNIQFSTNNTAFNNACLPTNTLNNTILAQWDDLRTDQQGACTSYGSGCGIFTSVSGTAPNRIFNVEWRAIYFTPITQLANFEVRMYESLDRFDIILGQVDQSGSSATVGVQRDTGSLFIQFECNTGGASQGLMLTFQALPCTTVTSTPTSTTIPTNTPTTQFTSTHTRTRTPTVTVTPTCPAATADNTIESFAFNPLDMTITAGSTVRWTNLDSVGHTATSDTGVWDSGIIPHNGQYSFTFTTPGTYTYHCIPHTYMTGTINVVICQSTATPTPGPVLVGHVTWQGPPAQPDARQQQPVTLTLKSSSTEVNYPPQTTDATGHFTVSVAGLPAGTYSWRAKGTKWLATSGSVSITGGPVTSVEMGLLRAGDCDDNNIVNLLDFNILKNTFGRSLGDPTYDPRADFDSNDSITIGDFNFVRLNFGQAGAPPAGP